MISLLPVLGLVTSLAAPGTFCELPAQCGENGVCVAGLCRQGAERAHVETLRTVAVMPGLPLGRQGWLADASHEASEELQRAMTWTGFYEPLPLDSFPAGWSMVSVSASDLDRSPWQKAGVDLLVRPALTPTGDPETYILQIHAFEMDRFQPLRLPQGDVIVRPGALRSAVAAWVDALVGHDTGLPGAVGSRLVATFETARGVKEVGLLETYGADIVWVTANGSLNLNPAWGPGGAIGYMSYRSGNTDWIVEGEPLSTRPGLNAAGAWSPNGRWLALSLSEGGNSELVILDARTSRIRRRVTDHRSVDTSPAWSPDGGQIAFVSDRTGSPQIWVADLKARTERRITQGGYVTSPSWSPLGQHIVYAQKLGPDRFALIRHDLESGRKKRLTPAGVSDDTPCYSPDGRYVVFVRREGTSPASLWIMHQDGQRARPLVKDTPPAFSPDWGNPYGARAQAQRASQERR